MKGEAERKSAGQIAYEEDVRRWPNYHSGEARKTWAQLGEPERDSWERNPTPRASFNLPAWKPQQLFDWLCTPVEEQP